MSRVVAIIPARYKSSRFPGKPLADLHGKPMLYYVCRQTAKARNIDETIVATDSEEIKEVIEQFGFRVVMTSPDHPTGTDRVAEASEHIDAEVIVNVQGDEPMIEPEPIELLVEAFLRDQDLQYGQLYKAIEDPADLIDSTVVKLAVDDNSNILYISRAPIPYPKANINYLAHKHIGVFGYRKEFLQAFIKLDQGRLEMMEQCEQLRAIEHGYRFFGIETQHDSISVDTPNDLAKVKQLMANTISG